MILQNRFTYADPSPTTWEVTDDGFLRVKARTLKEGVMPYARAELSGLPPELDGVDPILMLVPMESLASAETLRSLEGVQVVAPEHVWVTPENAPVSKGNTAGSPQIVGPYQEVDLFITDPATIEGVKTRQIGEISGGYTADTVFEAGTWNGQPYHAKQCGIKYNHVAVIGYGEGRGGSEVRILNKKNAEGVKPMIRVQLKNTKRFINVGSEEDAAALTEEGTASSKGLEETMSALEEKSGELAALQEEVDTLKGELSVYKEKIDTVLSEESIEAAAEGMAGEMVEEAGEAEEIIENSTFCNEKGEPDEKRREEVCNSIKGLRRTKLHVAVLNAIGVKTEGLEPAVIKGIFKAQNQILKAQPKRGTSVAGAQIMNGMPLETKGTSAVQRTSRERLGFQAKK